MFLVILGYYEVLNTLLKNYRMYQNQILHCRHSFQSVIFLNK